MHHRDCAIANGYPSAGAHHCSDKLLPQQGGIPWAAQRGIRNQRPLASYTFPCGDTNASSGWCHSRQRTISQRSSPRRQADPSARRHPPKGTPMRHRGRLPKGQCHSQWMRSIDWRSTPISLK
ncbi:hypothetical protein RHGRI_038509 [Rhododendron griersonianum]|uniref:Uncharacterized protein n=1 Tax=Rhododendron griersonianum TaxID=479676 RepID=A0AAV6HP97_9ERIC|nr:hypothetical protein RHGRI_038509 [Rhododendron griersonianum]